MNSSQALNDIQFTEEDANLVKDIYPFIDMQISEITDSVIAILAEDPDIVQILQNNNLSAERAKHIFVQTFKFIFSAQINDDFFHSLKNTGLKHVKAGTKEQFVLVALSLFRNSIIRKLFESSFRLSIKHILAINKLFDIVAITMLSSYSDEIDTRNEALIKFFGIKPALLERIVNEGKKFIGK